MLHRYLTRLTMIGVVLTLGACGEGDKTGPEDIIWDRDQGELCSMLISDPRFAAEVRGGEKKTLYKFDDIGCAINWLNRQPWSGDAATEIWVADYTSTREQVLWHNAREARYVGGKISPMDYGFGAVAPSTPASGEALGIGFVALTTQILGGKPNHICTVPE